jgi:hypothetical protein
MYVRNQCWVEALKLMFALRTTIVCDPVSEANVYISFSDIGLIPKTFDRLLILKLIRKINILTHYVIEWCTFFIKNQ